MPGPIADLETGTKAKPSPPLRHGTSHQVINGTFALRFSHESVMDALGNSLGGAEVIGRPPESTNGIAVSNAQLKGSFC